MKCCLVFTVISALVLIASGIPLKDEKNIVAKDYWSNSFQLNDYDNNPFKYRMLNDRLFRQKMRSGKTPYPPLRQFFNDNPGAMEMNALEKDPMKIMYDSNDDAGFEGEIDDGVWRNAKWTN